MKGEFHIALLLSLVAHGALIAVCPVPSPVESGQAGKKQPITVLGVVQVSAAPEKAEESQPASAASVKSPAMPEPDEPPEVLEAKPPEQKASQKEPEQETPDSRTPEKKAQPEPPPAEEAQAEVPEPDPEKATSVQPANVAAPEQSLKEANVWLRDRMERLAKDWEDAVAQPRRFLDQQVRPKAEKNGADPDGSGREKSEEQTPEVSNPLKKRKREDDRKQEPVVSKPSAPRAPALAENPSQGVKGSPGSVGDARKGGEDARLRYLTEVFRKLHEEKTYPPLARRREIEGKVRLELVIEGDGRLRHVRVLASSGHAVLDDAAQEMVRRCGLFEPLPGELGIESLKIVVPVSYALE